MSLAVAPVHGLDLGGHVQGVAVSVEMDLGSPRGREVQGLEAATCPGSEHGPRSGTLYKPAMVRENSNEHAASGDINAQGSLVS